MACLSQCHSERSEESNIEQFDESRFFVTIAPQNDKKMDIVSLARIVPCPACSMQGVITPCSLLRLFTRHPGLDPGS